MSVMIKGMEMPEGCYECPCARHDSFDGIQGYQCNVTLNYIKNEISRLLNCPLVEIPTPHGRLIDADAATKANAYRTGTGILAINAAPTVIEAEGEK